MKRFIFSLILLLCTGLVFAQSAYESTMTKKIHELENTNNPDSLTALSNDFLRIGEKEKTKWLPYYYASLSTIQKGRIAMQMGKMDELESAAELAQTYLDKATAISADNAEIYILSKMIHTLKLMINPVVTYATEGPLAEEALQKAEKLDPENPRITLLKAEDAYFTPENFGGDKKKGLELFKKALKQFDEYSPETALSPNWGKEEAAHFIKMAE